MLLADDDEWVREATSALLEFCGHEVRFARNGPEALKVFEAARTAGTPVDVVILDVRMPLMEGPEVLAALRALDHEIPVLICSGYERAQLDPALFREPHTGYLPKPMGLEVLETQLREVCPERMEALSPTLEHSE